MTSVTDTCKILPYLQSITNIYLFVFLNNSIALNLSRKGNYKLHNNIKRIVYLQTTTKEKGKRSKKRL